MGTITGFICRGCGQSFSVQKGGGIFFDLLHCDGCGRSKSVSHQELGDLHLRFVKGLDHPYAIARADMDRRIQAEHGRADQSRGVPRRCRGPAGAVSLRPRGP